MQALVLYDIPDDRLRGKVASLCADYGLQRIQYSAFLGPITRNRQEELLQKICGQAGKKALDVQLFIVCARDLELRLAVSQHEEAPASPSPTPRPRKDRVA
jgi:CRISPR-associated protein Cas2